MRTPLRATLLALAVLCTLPTVPTPHGSVFQPPDLPPVPEPDWKGPSDVTGRVGPPRGTGPRTPSRPRPPGPGEPSGGPTTPVNTKDPLLSLVAAQVDMTDWTWWWEFNKEPFLELRRHLLRTPTVTGSDGFYLGHGSRRPVVASTHHLDSSLIRGSVVPALLAALAEEPSTNVTTACLVALAKIGNDLDDGMRSDIAGVLRSHLTADNQEVSETATVALGILGHRASAFLLADIAADSATGRKALDRRRVPVRTRVFAAYGLGLVGHRTDNQDVRRFLVHKIARLPEDDDTPSSDFAVACVLSLGRMPLDWSNGEESPGGKRPVMASSRESQVAALLKILRNGRANVVVRAHAATSLGSLLVGEVPATHRDYYVEVLEELQRHMNAGARDAREVRQSSAIALGLLVDADDDDHDTDGRASLRRAASEDRDSTVRNFARIALARAAARPGTGELAADVADIRDLLLEDLTGGATATRRWTGLALGIYERFRVGDAPVDPEVAKHLHASLADAASPLDRGAFAVGSGILGDPKAEPHLRKLVEGKGDDWVRGLSAVALGLVEARGSLSALRALVSDAENHPDFLRELALALGLLQDREISGLLVERLTQARTLSTQASLARALGRIGDSESIGPLISLLGASEEVDMARSFAAVALGEVADQDALPWNTVFSVDTNYLAAPPTLFDLQGYGLLNIL